MIISTISWTKSQEKVQSLPLVEDYAQFMADDDSQSEFIVSNKKGGYVEIKDLNLLDHERNTKLFRTPHRSYFTVNGRISDSASVPYGWTEDMIRKVNEQFEKHGKVEIVRDQWETYTIDFWYLQKGDSMIPYYGEIYQTWWSYLE